VECPARSQTLDLSDVTGVCRALPLPPPPARITRGQLRSPLRRIVCGGRRSGADLRTCSCLPDGRRQAERWACALTASAKWHCPT